MNIITKIFYAAVITALIILAPGCAPEPKGDGESAAEINVETAYLEIIEQSLENAGLDDLTPLNEHLGRFREKQGKVFRELDLDNEEFGLAPRINLITHIEVDGELVELAEPLTLHEELFGRSSDEIGLLYRGDEITTVGRIMEAWHETDIITLAERVVRPPVTIIDETDKTKWPLTEIIRLAEEAFPIYFGRGEFRQVPGILTDEMETDLQRGIFSVMHYPGVAPAGPGKGYFTDEISVQLTKIIKEEDRVRVEARLAYPHIKSDSYQELKEKITDEILTAHTEGQTVSPRDVFTAVLEEANIDRAETQKNLEIIRVDDELKVSYVDPPENIFSSFPELYKEAVADQVDAVTVLTGEDEEKGASVKVRFAGALIEGDEHRFINQWLDPHYLLDKTTMVLPNGLEIPLENIWRPLAQKEYDNHPGYGFEGFLTALRFIEEAAHNKIVAYADYGVPPGGEAHVIFGYVDLETKEFNLFRFSKAGGASRRDESVRARFLWSPQGSRLAYTWLDTAGINHLEVYDIHTDEVIKITPEGLPGTEGADKINIIPPEKLPAEYEVQRLHYDNLKWSEAGDRLSFNIKEMEYSDGAWKQVEGTEVVDYYVTLH